MHQCRKRLEQFENSSGSESLCQGSRASSCNSLNESSPAPVNPVGGIQVSKYNHISLLLLGQSILKPNTESYYIPISEYRRQIVSGPNILHHNSLLSLKFHNMAGQLVGIRGLSSIARTVGLIYCQIWQLLQDKRFIMLQASIV